MIGWFDDFLESVNSSMLSPVSVLEKEQLVDTMSN